VQIPPQQSEPEAHVSPFCWQNDGEAHNPLAGQNPEQHCEPVVHGLPLLAHEGLRGVQVPELPHRPLQH